VVKMVKPSNRNMDFDSKCTIDSLRVAILESRHEPLAESMASWVLVAHRDVFDKQSEKSSLFKCHKAASSLTEWASYA
jgi:hypothetical protein